MRGRALPYGVHVQPEDPAIRHRKAALRGELIAVRRSRSQAERQVARAANGEHLLAALQGRRCIAAYLPLATEPLDGVLLDRLAALTRVLVPVAVGPAPLDWCRYPAPTRRGSLGIDEPTGDLLGPAEIAAADAILVPALAVDRQGHRLGRGGGHYDRTLALLDGLTRPGTELPLLIAVLFDGEVLDEVPVDVLDRRVSAVVTPATGVNRLA